MAKKNIEQVRLEIEGQSVPLKIFRERRRSLRAAVGKEHFILRLPDWLTAAQEKEGIEWFRQWAARMIQKNDSLVEQFNGRTFRDGEELRVGERRYRLQLRFEDRKTHSARLRDGVIYLDLNQQSVGPALSKAIRTLLSRIVGQDFLPAITRRVHELNERHFQKKIKGVRLKYNHSNWGSCSRTGNINLSTRLLFAPPDVVDYVIIHELAHLVELNHSPRFWRVVEQAMPDYEEKERWLRENRSVCDF